MRVVSLVPSLTQTLFDLGLTTAEVVGRTPWCIHPEEIVEQVMVIGGTKTPNLNKIRSLNPDLIVMDKEENPLEIFQTLASEGYTIFVSEVESAKDVPKMLQELGKACNRKSAGEQLALLCEDSLNQISKVGNGLRTVPLIWYEPLMAVGPNKYAGSILSLVGFDVIDTNPDGNGYPEVSVADFIDHDVELILLTSEPHEFTLDEGNGIAANIVKAGGKAPTIKLIDGEDLTWFGSRTAPAIARLADFHDQITITN